MELGTFLVVIPIFILFYQGMGMFFESRSEKEWVTSSEAPKTELGKQTLQGFIKFSEKLAFNRALLRYKKLSDRLDLLLIYSGHPFGWKSETFLLIKEIAALFFIIVIARAGGEQPLLYLIAGLGGFWMPDLYLQAKARERQASIRKQLPGFVDLSALTLEGGLDFMAAVERIMDKMKVSFLKEELNMLLQECRLGTPRKEALQHLAFRVNLSDMHSLASMIIQSEELGTSLSGVLRNYAEDMRSKRILRAEEMAGKAPVKLLFPMMVFFFPIVFVIIFGPIALNFMAGK